jgi:hypothetical protein
VHGRLTATGGWEEPQQKRIHGVDGALVLGRPRDDVVGVECSVEQAQLVLVAPVQLCPHVERLLHAHYAKPAQPARPSIPVCCGGRAVAVAPLVNILRHRRRGSGEISSVRWSPTAGEQPGRAFASRLEAPGLLQRLLLSSRVGP